MNNFKSKTYSIKDLQTLSGIKAHTLRVWERRYGIFEPGRTKSNIRHYSEDQLKDLLNVSLLAEKGYKISFIAGLSEIERSKLLLELDKDDSSNGITEQFLTSLIDLDENKFNAAFSIAIHNGFEQGVALNVLPFLRKVGLLWQTGTICTAQEHFFSHLVRQKIISATGNLGLINGKKSHRVLFLLPEFELHELNLLFYNYLFKVRGYATIYLGQAVPLAGLAEIIDNWYPEIIVTGFTMSFESKQIVTFMDRLQHLAPGAAIYGGGARIDNYFSEVDLHLLLNISHLFSSRNNE